MVNRFKVLLLVPLAIALGILFVQNQQSLSIKLLCPDASQDCFYQTRRLPLALWMALSIFAGIVSSLFWQLLNHFGYSGSKNRYYSTSSTVNNNREDLTPIRKTKGKRSRATGATKNSTSDWEDDRNSEDWESQPQSNFNTASEYEVRQEPEKVERSGSTYSYKFKEKSDRSETSPESEPDLSVKPNLDKTINTEDDEDWI